MINISIDEANEMFERAHKLEIEYNICVLKECIKNASLDFTAIEFRLFSGSAENIVCMNKEIMNQVRDFIIEKSYEKIKKLEQELENL